MIPQEVREWVDVVYSHLSPEERTVIAWAKHAGVTVERATEILAHVERKYWNLSTNSREQLLSAYLKSSKRDPSVFLVERGVHIEDHIPSDRYKEHLFLQE